VLAKAGFDAFSLANNHAWDRGPQGAIDTRTHLEAAGIELFGVGVDQDEAERPLIIDTPYGKVGVVGIESLHTGGEEAGPDQPGTPRLRKSTIERAHQAALDAGARWVVAYTHWGLNYRGVNIQQKWFAHRLVDAGFDLVIGHGPHIQQPVGRIDGVPVLYSLGNFVFNTPGRFQKLDQPPWGLVARTYLGPEGFEGVELSCMFMDNRITNFQVRPCTEQERAESFGGLGPEVEVRGELGVVTF
jgi:poly-gamma-glutamate capsule biosynthesis protein CapA/YwtB (metallophosphatase superfamily)